MKYQISQCKKQSFLRRQTSPLSSLNISAKIIACAISISGITLLTSCTDDDPSYEKEIITLHAEKDDLTQKLKELTKENDALQTRLDKIKSERDQLKSTVESSSTKPSTNSSRVKFDPRKIKISFSNAVADLEEKIQRDNPSIRVDKVSFQNIHSSLEFPFSSVVETYTVVKSTGEKKVIYWKAVGNLKGQWKFSQQSTRQNTSSSQMARNTTQSPTGRNGNSKQIHNRQATQPKKPKRPVSTDPNVHIIDWSKAK